MKLSIVIPCYNERNTILEAFRRVEEVELPLKKEIIVVDDGSTDGSGEIIEKDIGNRATVLLLPKNCGKGAAVRRGLEKATGDFIIIQDADLEQYPRDYPKLLQPLLAAKADVVYGTRMINYRVNSKESRLIFIATLLLNLAVNLLYGSSITDVMSGYKVFRRKVLKGIAIKSSGFEFETEITAKILKKGYTIHEVPIHFKARDFTEGKKISWSDAPKILYYLVKYRFIK